MLASSTFVPAKRCWRSFITLEMRGHDNGQRVKMNPATQTRASEISLRDDPP